MSRHALFGNAPGSFDLGRISPVSICSSYVVFLDSDLFPISRIKSTPKRLDTRALKDLINVLSRLEDNDGYLDEDLIRPRDLVETYVPLNPSVLGDCRKD